MLDIRGFSIALDPRICSFVGFQTGNWMPKTNLGGRKKTNLAGTKVLVGTKNWRLDKNTNWHPNKNYFGGNTYYKYNNN